MPVITLVGYRGTGKSTVAAAVADRLGCDWVDADAVLEERVGTSIASLVRERGETTFRDEESTILAELLASCAGVLSTGGGAVLRPLNRGRLRALGRPVVWLTASCAVIRRRLAADPHTASRRPGLAGADPLDEIDSTVAHRAALPRGGRCDDRHGRERAGGCDPPHPGVARSGGRAGAALGGGMLIAPPPDALTVGLEWIGVVVGAAAIARVLTLVVRPLVDGDTRHPRNDRLIEVGFVACAMVAWWWEMHAVGRLSMPTAVGMVVARHEIAVRHAAHVVLAGLLVAAAWVDLRYRVIPDVITMPGASWGCCGRRPTRRS